MVGGAIAEVLGIAESEDGPKDEAEEAKADAEARRFAEALGELDVDDEEDDDADQGDEHEEKPPTGLAIEFEQNDRIMKWDQAGTSRFACFGP